MEAAAVDVDMEKEVTIASRLENPFHIKASKETEEENQNENKDLDCEGKVWPAVEADGNLASRPCDNSIIDSPSSEACSSGTAGESCGITERPGDPSSMPASNDIVKQSKKDEVKVEDEDLKDAEGNGDYTSTPRDSNILDSTSSELRRPVQGSYVTSKEPQYSSDVKTGKKILHSEEQKNEDKDVKEVWPKAEDTPVQAQQQTQPQAPKSLEAAGSSVPFVVCEICDGYLTDLVHLRLHMHRIHHLVIHRATLTHRPPLNCQKCERRFFTDQGLERHLLGAHGMVTPNMQSLAKHGKDAGRCPACGRMYATKLVSHMSA
ncbi:hypothetical protein HPB49_008855 [Dermacentor silvarum]|uniref:Uncharacterized protein n=1 Tax=Dermacentor silvarum TaxID=543639 RepID=A0ACB8DC33_DERSI|nr:hypothetical protein HPB49_008855 [Dermacentor silvarum]